MLGFWAKPDETVLALRDDWVYSGDLGRVDGDGYLHLTGRTKELYKSGGELVMPVEIEALVDAHPAVSQAYGVGVPDDTWGEIGWLYVTAEAEADQQAVIAEIETLRRDNLAKFKVPKRVIFADAATLPIAPTGKVQKFRLVERALAEMNDVT
ncbi:MAG: fatty-acyl-CoA synthase [Acidimicrobiales bacterium]|jgi:fatty-acyl-CoA synthase